tara:strand:- start:60141 stop:61001 length:861 start_codon:yes stop_codon:yes gene_type:complete
MKRTIILLILLSLPFATADLLQLTTVIQDAQTEMVGQELNGPIAKVFGDSNINLHIQVDNEGEVVMGIVTEEEIVQEVSLKPLDKPDLNIYTNEDVIDKIVNSNQPLLILLSALEDKEITYKAEGFINKVKFAFINVLIKMAGGFMDDSNNENIMIAEKPHKNVQKEMEASKNELNNIIKEPQPIQPKEDKITGNFVASPINLVSMINSGFSQSQIVIKQGETVTWKNERTGKVNLAMVVGTQLCTKVRSTILNNGDEFKYKFDQSGTCTIVDGIMTTKVMKVIVR